MKIGITCLYTIFRYGYPPSLEDDFRVLKDICKLGFHYLETEHDLHVHNFCIVDPDLVSLDPAKWKKAYRMCSRPERK